MSNEIVLSEKLPIKCMSDMNALGDMIAKSGLLGVNNPAAGLVIVAHCHTKGISILDFARDHDVIQNKVCKKSHAMVADFIEAGGKYQIHSRTSEKCELSLEIAGRKLKDSIEWKEIQSESYTKKKDGVTLKDNWSSPRRRKQMLYVRLMSDMIRAIAPNVCRDYISEEFDKDLEKNITSSPKPTPMAAEKLKTVMKEAEVVHENKFPKREPTTDPEPDPFDKQIEEYTKCPIPGKMMETLWADMPLTNLRIAEKMKHETLMSGHYKAINEAIKTKELAEMENLNNA